MVLLSCLPNERRTPNGPVGQTAVDIKLNLISQLDLIGRDPSNIDFLCGDNCSTNKRLAKDLGVPFVGCYSHRLNLAVQKYLKNDSYLSLLGIVNELMTALRTSKNISRLAAKTRLKPELRNVTRWSSAYNMLKKYEKLSKILLECGFGDDVLSKIPSAIEHQQILDLIENMKQVQNVCLELQKDSVDLCTAQFYFERK